MARGAYLRELGNTPGHLNHWSKRSFARLLARNGETVELRSPFPWTMALVRVPVGSASVKPPRADRSREKGPPEGGMSYGRGATLLSALIGVTGLLTYAFHSLVAHTLGRDSVRSDRRRCGRPSS